MTNKKSHLFLFTISPVQSFVAQARKTQDLYAGSKILSELCKEGLRYIHQEYNAQFIFPYSIDAISIPNRFVVRMEGDKDWNAIGQEVEMWVRDYWEKSIAYEACKSLGFPENMEAFSQQIRQHLEIYWAFQSIEADYQKAYRQLENVIGAIKNIRTFEQYTYQSDLPNAIGERGRKCSLDGERNVKYYRLGEGETKAAALKNTNLCQQATDLVLIACNASKPPRSVIQVKEGLSAISMIKRKYQTIAFPSTAEIALMYSLDKAIKIEVARKAISSYINTFFKDLDFKINVQNYTAFSALVRMLESKGFNWQFFYEESIRSIDSLQKMGYPIARNDYALLQQIQRKHRKMVAILRTHNIALTKYYALMVFDGDDMGGWFGGGNVKEGQLEQFHKVLSERLSVFAATAQLQEPYGKTVYSGGDDFLGFLNLHHLLPKVEELRIQFDKIVNENSDFQNLIKYDDELITYSSGIAIAHYKTPLSAVLKQARKAEKAAKSYERLGGSKDNCAIAVMKRSGETQMAVCPYFYKTSLLSVLHTLAETINQGNLSPKFIQALRQRLHPIMDFRINKTENERTLEKMIFSEIGSVLSRQSDGLLDINSQLKALQELFESSRFELDNLLSLLDIVVFISRHLSISEEPILNPTN